MRKLSQNKALLYLAVSTIGIITGCSNTEPASSTNPPASTPAGQQQPGAAPPAEPAKGVVSSAVEKVKAVVAPPPPVTLAEGTKISARLIPSLSTKTAAAGQVFEATLAEPLIVGDYVVAPKGARANGVVVASDDGGRVKGRASIAVKLTSIEANGKEIVIATSNYAREAPGSKKKDAATVGIASGVGAAIGAIAGGGRGAAIGAGAGAGGGTGVVLATRGKPAVLPSETLMSFRLTAPVTVQRK